LAGELTAGSTRDAEAVISHLVAQKAASVLFTDPTPDSKEPVAGLKFGAAAPTAADKGILQAKAALQRMEVLAAHLEASVAAETAAATAAARSGNKADALARLRKKKLLDNKLAGARASVHKLTDVLMAVDEAASNKEAVQALEIGMDSLRAATANGVTAGRIDAIASDYADHTADQEDVRVALQQLNQSPQGLDDAAAEEAELAAMMAVEDTGHSLGAPDSSAVTGSAEEEAELDRIMAELGISKNDTADLPTPPSPTGASPERTQAPARVVGKPA
jgi:Snf7